MAERLRLALVGALKSLAGAILTFLVPAAGGQPVVAFRWDCASTPGQADRVELITRDCERARGLGFTCAWIDGLPADRLDEVIVAIHSAGLRPVVREPAISRYVEHGRLPADSKSVEGLVASRWRALQRRCAGTMLALPPFPHPAGVERCREVLRALGRARPTGEALIVVRAANLEAFESFENAVCAVWDPVSVPERPGGPAGKVITIIHPVAAGESPESAWFRQYHEGATRGLTDGFLVWRFRSWPAETNGLTSSDGALSTSAASIVSKVAQRAAEWARYMRRARRIEADGIRADEKFGVIAFRRNGRRLLLVRNRDPEHFSRGTLRVAAQVDGEPVNRVINPDSGDRFLRSGASIEIPLVLRPADAALFEIY